MEFTSNGNTIGGLVSGAGNVISGNTLGGVDISTGSSNNLVVGNFIGTDSTGQIALPNAANGVLIDIGASSNTIGGAASGSANVISSNASAGIEVIGADGNVIQGNFIGTDAGGSIGMGNVGDGIYVLDSSNTTIGGTISGAGNLVSANQVNGIGIESQTLPATGNLVIGNTVGLDVTGFNALGNAQVGIGILNASGNTIGGTAAGSGNIASGNGQVGIGLSATTGVATANVVQGNLVGTNAFGTSPVGNGTVGVGITGASANTIGGTAPGSGNLISGNVQLGIGIVGADGNAEPDRGQLDRFGCHRFGAAG